MTKTVYMELAPASYGALSAAGLCIAAGATVLVVGFVGCCGAWIESKCLLLTVRKRFIRKLQFYAPFAFLCLRFSNQGFGRGD